MDSRYTICRKSLLKGKPKKNQQNGLKGEKCLNLALIETEHEFKSRRRTVGHGAFGKRRVDETERDIPFRIPDLQSVHG